MNTPYHDTNPRFDHVNPALAVQMKKVAGTVANATEAIGPACRHIEALDPNETRVERFALAGLPFNMLADWRRSLTAELSSTSVSAEGRMTNPERFGLCDLFCNFPCSQ